MRMDVGFAARDYAGIADARKLQDARGKARTRARDEAIRLLIEAHRDEFDALREREFLAQHEMFLRRLEATARQQAGGRR